MFSRGCDGTAQSFHTLLEPWAWLSLHVYTGKPSHSEHGIGPSCFLMTQSAEHACTRIYRTEAHARSQHFLFADGGGVDFDDDFERNVMSRMVVALSQVVVSALTQAREEEGSGCTVNIRPCVATEECALIFSNCRGPDIDGVIPCCRSDQACYRRTPTVSACRPRGAGPPSFFLGDMDAFPVCPAEIDQ